MRDKQYKVKAIRLDEKVWDEMKKQRKKLGLSWNLYLKQLIKKP